MRNRNELILCSLYNLQVPYTFYNITESNNTLCFQYGTNLCMYTNKISQSTPAPHDLNHFYYNNMSIHLEPGNYNAIELIAALESKINEKLDSIDTICDLTDWYELFLTDDTLLAPDYREPSGVPYDAPAVI